MKTYLVAPVILTLTLLSAVVYAIDLQDELEADFQLGVDAYAKGNYQTALKNFKPLAEQGDARAQFCLGVMYTNGYGVPKDYIQAHMWLNLAGVDGDKNTEELRYFVEKRMTAFDISVAQKLAREKMEKQK